MNTSQAVNNNCGYARQFYSRATLISLLSLNVDNLSINRPLRKIIWKHKVWNFDRQRFLNRFTKQRYSVSFPYHSILCGNIRSIRNKLDEVKETVLVHNCDINVFTESWLNSFCKDNITSINGYNQFRLDREQKHGGGIIVYVRDHIRASIIPFDTPSTLKFCLSIVHLPINSLYVFTIRIGNKQLLIMTLLICFFCLFHPPKNQQTIACVLPFLVTLMASFPLWFLFVSHLALRIL